MIMSIELITINQRQLVSTFNQDGAPVKKIGMGEWVGGSKSVLSI